MLLIISTTHIMSNFLQLLTTVKMMNNMYHIKFNTLKPKPERGSVSSNFLCGPHPSAAHAYIFIYVTITQRTWTRVWFARKLSINSPLFGAANWGVLFALFKKNPFTIICLQSRCGLQFVLQVCCVDFRVFRKKNVPFSQWCACCRSSEWTCGWFWFRRRCIRNGI